MNSDKNTKTTQRLRFPEFSGSWEQKPLSSFLFEHKTKSDGKCEVHSVSVSKGVVNQVEYLGRSFAAADTSKYNLAKPNDIIYTKSPTGAFPFGIVKQNKNPYNVIVSPLYAVYTPINKYIGYILDSYFESPAATNNYLSSLIQKGAKNTIQISNDTFVSKNVCLPTDYAEQKKIALFLSEIDALIAAQGQKVEALKERKRGLMQQLFPQPGETTPRLRFPGFAGEWEKKKLGDCFEIGNGRDYKHLEQGNIPVYGSGGYMCSVNNYLYDGDSACIGRKGTINKPMLLHGRFWAVDTLFYTYNYIDTSAYFVYLLFQNINWLNHNEAGGVPSLSKNIINNISVLLPPTLAEQEKIAECLSAMEDLIIEESNRLEFLKTHKRGLMQQMFPNTSK